jgi:hypothetical protein
MFRGFSSPNPNNQKFRNSGLTPQISQADKVAARPWLLGECCDSENARKSQIDKALLGT